MTNLMDNLCGFFHRIRPVTSRFGLILSAALFVLLMPDHLVWAGLDQYPGVVVKVDTGNSYIVVMNPKTGGRFRFTITEKTDVTENEDFKNITDLVPGTPVIVDYEQSGENYIARRIVIQPSGQ